MSTRKATRDEQHRDERSELQQLLDELDRLADEQGVIDSRDPNALSDCERRVSELRRRIEEFTKRRLERFSPHQGGGATDTSEESGV